MLAVVLLSLPSCNMQKVQLFKLFWARRWIQRASLWCHWGLSKAGEQLQISYCWRWIWRPIKKRGALHHTATSARLHEWVFCWNSWKKRMTTNQVISFFSFLTTSISRSRATQCRSTKLPKIIRMSLFLLQNELCEVEALLFWDTFGVEFVACHDMTSSRKNSLFSHRLNLRLRDIIERRSLIMIKDNKPKYPEKIYCFI